MRVAIAQRAVQRDQCEELLHVFVDMRGIRELSESLHHRGLVAAAIFLVGPAGVERAEVLESRIGSVHAQIEAVDDQQAASCLPNISAYISHSRGEASIADSAAPSFGGAGPSRPRSFLAVVRQRFVGSCPE